jgi:hypothetical protein
MSTPSNHGGYKTNLPLQESQVSPSLHPDHVQDLARSGLTPDDLERLGVRVWTLTPTDLERFLKQVGFGWALPCARSAYVLQYPADGYYRVRLFWADACQHTEKLPKYLGPPGRPVPAFVVEPVQALAGKRMQAIAVVEGEKKALALLKAGVNAVGIGGCWCFKGPDGDLVEPLDTWEWRDRIVYLVPDGDWRVNPDVVQAWTTFGLLLAAKEAAPHVVTWDPKYGKGVDDAIAAGLDVRASIESATPLTEWVAETARRFRNAVLGALASVDLPSDLADGLIRAIARSLSVSHRAVRVEVRRRREVKDRVESDVPDPEPTPEIRAWLSRPDLVDAILGAVRQVHAGDDDNALALLLAWASLRFDDPVSVLIQGPPSTGKSHLIETLRSLWPPESYVFRSSLSPRALAYTDENLAHRAVILAEAVSLVTSDESGYLVRTLLSEGRIVHESVEKTASGLKAVKLEREGPTALFATTTRLKLEEQLVSRVWLLESKSDATYLSTALDAIAFGETRVPNADAIRQALSWLYWHGNSRVRIPEPLLKALRGLFAGKDPVELRVFKRLLASIRASAFLHQMQRPVDADGYVLATEQDYRIARRALAASFETATGDLTPRQREVWGVVHRLGAATLGEIAKETGMRKPNARRMLKTLRDKGYITQDPATGNYRTVESPDGGIILPENLDVPPGDNMITVGPKSATDGDPARYHGDDNGMITVITPVPQSATDKDLGRYHGDDNGMITRITPPDHEPDNAPGNAPDNGSDPPLSPLSSRYHGDDNGQKSSTDANSAGGVITLSSPGDTKFLDDPQAPKGGPASRHHSAINAIAPGDDMAQDPPDGSKLGPVGPVSQTLQDDAEGGGNTSDRPQAPGPPQNGHQTIDPKAAGLCFDCWDRGVIKFGYIIGPDGRRRCGPCASQSASTTSFGSMGPDSPSRPSRRR